jgi:glycosyltransferase 2 family protein
MAVPQIGDGQTVAAAVESSSPRSNSVAKFSFRFFAALLGLALLTTLVLRTGPQTIWNQVHKVGFGLVLVILLGGLAHLTRTWSWRLIVGYDITAVPWSRSFAACLVSEALGQLGVGGKVLGEGMRISLLRSAVPLTNAIPASAIDGGIHIATSMIVMLSGISATLLLAPLSGTWRNFALMIASAVIAALILVFVSIGKRWALMGNAARAIGRVPRFHEWIGRKLSVIDSSEQNLLNFLHEAPARFCAAFLLNFLWQAITILEVYIILRFMGTHTTVLRASVMEGLTKLINLVGAFNPGNVGTYEGGNMLITKLFSVSGTVGLTLALCRRACVLFWALIGAICLMLMRTPNEHGNHNVDSNPSTGVVHL